MKHRAHTEAILSMKLKVLSFESLLSGILPVFPKQLLWLLWNLMIQTCALWAINWLFGEDKATIYPQCINHFHSVGSSSMRSLKYVSMFAILNTIFFTR